MSNIKKRLERLERARPREFAIVLVEPGETQEEAWQKNLAQHPEDEETEGAIFLHCSSRRAPPSGPPPSRPQPPKGPGAAGTRPRQITE
jgi:hypothetical protein